MFHFNSPTAKEMQKYADLKGEQADAVLLEKFNTEIHKLPRFSVADLDKMIQECAKEERELSSDNKGPQMIPEKNLRRERQIALLNTIEIINEMKAHKQREHIKDNLKIDLNKLDIGDFGIN